MNDFDIAKLSLPELLELIRRLIVEVELQYMELV